MAERDSGWVGGSVVDAQDARLATGTLVQAGAGPLQVRQGIKPASGTPGLVKQTGTASVNVTIEPFQAAIQATRATAGGPYLATLDAQKTIDMLTSHPADATNARRDLIIARQSDTQWSDASTAMAVQQVVGTPSGSPVDPTPATGDYITLARVTVPANAATITSGNITDLRPFAVAAGGILPVASQTERDALTKYTGMAVWRLDLSQLEAWNGTSWTVVGPPALPMLSVYRNAALSIASGTPPGGGTVIGWDAEEYQDNVPSANAMHNTASNNTRLIAPVSGKYLVLASYETSGSNTNGRYVISLYKNATTMVKWSTGTTTSASGNFQVSVQTVLKLSASDYIEVYGGAPSSSTALAPGANLTYASMSYLSS